jgi:hypothetical protein
MNMSGIYRNRHKSMNLSISKKTIYTNQQKSMKLSIKMSSSYRSRNREQGGSGVERTSMELPQSQP